MISQGQITITSLNDITTGSTPPASPKVDQLWADTSINPNRVKKWNGTYWEGMGGYTFTSQPITPYSVGDLWVQGSLGDTMVCNIEKLSGVYAAGDWSKSSKYTDDTAVNNLVIGGRNLLRNSKIGEDSNLYGFALRTDINLIAGKTYILSANGNTANALNGKYLKIYLDWVANWALFGFSFSIQSISDSTVFYKFTAPFTGSYKLLSYYFNSSAPRDGSVRLNWYKLEEGNKATDWTPAPEDIAADILVVKNAAEQGIADAKTGNDTLARIADDNWITAQEKPDLWREYQAITQEVAGIRDQADSFGVSYAAYDIVYNALTGMVGTNLDNLTTDWSLGVGGGVNLRNAFNNYYLGRTSLQNNIVTAAKLVGTNAQATANAANTAIANIKPAGKNYLQGSRMDSGAGWQAIGGTVLTVLDASYGSVVEYSRPAGGGDWMKLFTIDTLELRNTDVIFYAIAKPIVAGAWSFGGWTATLSMLNNNSQYRDLGNGWRFYYKAFASGSLLRNTESEPFGLNSVGGTWRFHSFGVCKGNQPPADWDASPKDMEYVRQAIASTTDVNGGVITPVLLRVKDVNGKINGGMSGLISDNIFTWSGGLYEDALASATTPSRVAVIDRKDGSGHRAKGKLLWDKLGNLFVGAFSIIDGAIKGFNALKDESIKIHTGALQSLASMGGKWQINPWIEYEPINPNITTPQNTSGAQALVDLSMGLPYSYYNATDFAIADNNIQVRFIAGVFTLTTTDSSGSPAYSNNGLTQRFKLYKNGVVQNGGVAYSAGEIITLGAGNYQAEFILSTTITVPDRKVGRMIVGTTTPAKVEIFKSVAQTEIAADGFMSYWSAGNYFRFSQAAGAQGRGNFDIPAGLGGGTIDNTGSILSAKLWGKITSGMVVKSGTSYTINHNWNDSDLSVILTPTSGSVAYKSSQTTNTIVITCASGFDFIVIRTK